MNMNSGATARLHRRVGAFTLIELLVSIVVVVLLVFMFTQLLSSATAVSRNDHKRVDTDTQARVVLDRMALDFAQMVKRIDVDYYIKQPGNYNGHGNGHGCGSGRNGDKGSDQIAFFSQVPGYYPSNYTTGQQSPISLVAYRVNESNSGQAADRYGRLERMAKGLGWNGLISNPNQNSPYPIVFLPQTISNISSWSAAINNDNNAASRDDDYEVIGPNVFRFEYYYLLKTGRVADRPWDTSAETRNSLTDPPPSIGLSRIEAISVSIAVIDPAARALIQAASSQTGNGDILDLAAELPDFKNTCGRGGGNQKSLGQLEDQWNGILQGIAQTGQTPQGKLIPREAAKGIRVYNRYFDLKTW
jgi:type II secretory pathway pseudopilin PulG